MTKPALRFLLWRFTRDERGSAAVEYSVLIGMIFLIIVGVMSLGGQLGTLFNTVSDKTTAALGF